MDLLLFSNSTNFGSTMLAHGEDAIKAHLTSRRVVFVPYAIADWDGYTATVAKVLNSFGIEVVGIHTLDDPLLGIAEAGAVYVGGGNSFRLLKTLQELDLLAGISELVRSGAVRYMGASAGTNLTCPTIRTTNDMPIVEPPSFGALDLLPFQINPHFIDADPTSRHMGETRETRLAEFLEENDVAILGLREGAWLEVHGQQMTLRGATGAVLMRRGAEMERFDDGADLSHLLHESPHFDVR